MKSNKVQPSEPNAAIDPTLRTFDISIKGKAYTLCFHYGSLALAEHELNASGENVNLNQALSAMTAWNTQILFAVAIRRFHPEISYREALALLENPADGLAAAGAVSEAWMKCFAEQSESAGEKKNPTQPGQ